MKYTPGPWDIDEHRPWITSLTTESVVAVIEADVHHDGEREANAKLIAKAPEMIALISETLNKLDDWLREDLSDEIKAQMLRLEDKLQKVEREAGVEL